MNLRIVIDGRYINDAAPGIGRYTYNLIVSLAELAADDQLIVLGNSRLPNRGYEQVERQMQTPELRQRVHLGGYVERKDLVLIYQNASAFVYPSLGEGFGLPPLEAMACGIPTIATDTSSLKENLIGAALLVPPDSVTALADAMAEALNHPETRANLKERGLARAREFPWETTARKTLECYQKLA